MERRIFGLNKLYLSIITGAAAPLVSLIFLFDELKNEVPVLILMFLGVQVLMLYNFSWIVVERNSLKVYHIISAITRKPKTLYMDEIKKMHIIKMVGNGGYVEMNFLLKDDTQTSTNATLLSTDIRAFEQFMKARGVEVLHPEE